MAGDALKRVNVAAALMGVDVPDDVEPSEVDRIVEEDQKLRERRAKLRAMKPWQRRKAERDARRVRVSLRLPEPLLDLVQEISQQEITSPSSAAEWLIAEGVRLWNSGKAPAPQVTRPRSIRVKVSLILPDEWDGKRQSRTFDLPHAINNVSVLAQEYGCGRSDAAAWLMSIGASAYRSGTVPEREFSNDIRYTFRLKLPRVRGERREGRNGSPIDALRSYLDSEY